MTENSVSKERKVSLKGMKELLADTKEQRKILGEVFREDNDRPSFNERLKASGLFPLVPTGIDVLQVNVGKMCNQTCRHCHVDAGPDRTEIMDRDTMQGCLDLLSAHPALNTVDITGGAPEMNPGFRWFVEEIRKLHRKVIVRCNLTIIVSNRKYHELPRFYSRNRVEVVSSLPFYSQDRTDRQRGNGVFDGSIKALKMLNAEGYGQSSSGLVLNLVYNPAGTFLPPSQDALETSYKEALLKNFGIHFNRLFVITNLPVNRFLDYLLKSGNYERYMEKLIAAYNPRAAAQVMCRNTISVGWDGYLYDCDFNQMLDLKMDVPSQHISDFRVADIKNRNIVTGAHCYGCTAGAGSSCGGATV